MSMNIFTLFGYALLSLGIFLTMSVMLGLCRFNDIYTRIHITTINDMLGIPVTILGTASLFLGLGNVFTAIKLGIGVIIWYIVAPISNYIIIKMIYFYNDEKE